MAVATSATTREEGKLEDVRWLDPVVTGRQFFSLFFSCGAYSNLDGIRGEDPLIHPQG